MTLGALVDVGVPPEILTEGLSTLKLDAEFSLRFEKATKHGITGTRAIVEVHPAHVSHADSHHHAMITGIITITDIHITMTTTIMGITTITDRRVVSPIFSSCLMTAI